MDAPSPSPPHSPPLRLLLRSRPKLGPGPGPGPLPPPPSSAPCIPSHKTLTHALFKPTKTPPSPPPLQVVAPSSPPPERPIPSSRGSGDHDGGGRPEVSHLGWDHWYNLQELKATTKTFSNENVIREGGYGIVYHGILEDKTKSLKNLLNKSL